MNNEFKYGIQGLLMAIGFFVALKILFFFIGISSQEQSRTSVATAENNIPSVSSTKFPEGKALFSSNCASCHAVNKTLTGPALAGILDRVPDRKLLYAWIRNSSKIVNSGDPYFVSLYNSYNKIQMNKFPNLTDEEIDAILNYITEQGSKPNMLPIAGIVVACP